jgi:hypothetical protein
MVIVEPKFLLQYDKANDNQMTEMSHYRRVIMISVIAIQVIHLNAFIGFTIGLYVMSINLRWSYRATPLHSSERPTEITLRYFDSNSVPLMH